MYSFIGLSNSEIVGIFYEFLGDKSSAVTSGDFYENLESQKMT